MLLQELETLLQSSIGLCPLMLSFTYGCGDYFSKTFQMNNLPLSSSEHLFPHSLFLVPGITASKTMRLLKGGILKSKITAGLPYNTGLQSGTESKSVVQDILQQSLGMEKFLAETSRAVHLSGRPPRRQKSG